ncbi:MAG: YbbR-like domain-containing protein [Polyangiaceae bacterium]|nr:YbbR-like domain-containing protein [Polyangiaceae bacterium]
MSRRSDVWLRIKGVVFDNLWLKVLSLLFAVGFYSFINGSRVVQRTVSVPLIADMPPQSSQRELMNQLPNAVTVTVSGTEAQLDALRAIEPVHLNLAEGRIERVDFEPEMLSLPPGVKAERIVPAALNLRWEDVVSRQVRVEVRLAGEPAKGFVVSGSPLVDPLIVTATGPKSAVLTLQIVRAADFSVSNLTDGEHKHTLALDRPPDLVSYDRESVDVLVRIERQLGRAAFSHLAVEVVGYPKAKTLPPKIDVHVSGTPEAVAALSAELLLPRVMPGPDAEKAGSVLLDVLVDAPNVKIDILPPRVLVKF